MHTCRAVGRSVCQERSGYISLFPWIWESLYLSALSSCRKVYLARVDLYGCLSVCVCLCVCVSVSESVSASICPSLCAQAVNTVKLKGEGV
jgi:hypothetical protein